MRNKNVTKMVLKMFVVGALFYCIALAQPVSLFNYGIQTVYAESDFTIGNTVVNIEVDGVLMTGFDDEIGKPVIITENGVARTLVPARKVYEQLGFTVTYDSSSNTATLQKDDKIITAKIGDKFITVNGKRVDMDTTAKIINNRTMLPLRTPLEAVGGITVNWDGNTSTASITTVATVITPAKSVFDPSQFKLMIDGMNVEVRDFLPIEKEGRILFNSRALGYAVNEATMDRQLAYCIRPRTDHESAYWFFNNSDTLSLKDYTTLKLPTKLVVEGPDESNLYNCKIPIELIRILEGKNPVEWDAATNTLYIGSKTYIPVAMDENGRPANAVTHGDIGKITIDGQTIYLGESKSSIEGKLGAPSRSYEDGGATTFVYQDSRTYLKYSKTGRLVSVTVAQPGFSYNGHSVGEVYNRNRTLKAEEDWLPGYGYWPTLRSYDKLIMNPSAEYEFTHITVDWSPKDGTLKPEPSIFNMVSITLGLEDSSGTDWSRDYQ